MRGWGCVLVTLAWLTAVSGQTSRVDIKEFFRRHALDDAQPVVLPATTFRGSLFESYDLRTETRDFDAGRQQFTVRFNFGTPGLIRAQQALYTHLTGGPPREASGAYCAAVERLYEDWLTLFELGESLRLHDSLLLIQADRQRLGDYATGALLSDPEERYRLRTRRTDLMIDTLRLRQQERSLRRYYGLPPSSLAFSLPSTEAVRQQLLSSERAQAARLAAEQQYRLAALDREEALELAEGRQLLDFLQFQYNSNNQRELREKFSVGVAFRIEDSGDRRLKLQELRVEREELRQEYRLSTQVFLAKESVERQQLLLALDYYSALGTLIAGETADLTDLARVAVRDQRRSPELLLDMAERGVRHRLRMLRAYLDVLDHYLQWRNARDELCAGADGFWLAAGSADQGGYK